MCHVIVVTDGMCHVMVVMEWWIVTYRPENTNKSIQAIQQSDLHVLYWSNEGGGGGGGGTVRGGRVEGKSEKERAKKMECVKEGLRCTLVRM